MQRITVAFDTAVATHDLPDEYDEVLPGLRWGRFDHLFTPAFWAWRGWLHSDDKRFTRFRLGNDLLEEVAACILGGYGISAEVGLAAYHRLRMRGLITAAPRRNDIYESLNEPLQIGNRSVRYRFPRQRSTRLAEALCSLASMSLHVTSHELRDLLLRIRGIGPKTASWVVRNYLGSDDVAILDVHVCRACVAAGVFSKDVKVQRDYFLLEERFLRFANAIGVRSSVLDAVMWHHMRNIGNLVRM